MILRAARFKSGFAMIPWQRNAEWQRKHRADSARGSKKMRDNGFLFFRRNTYLGICIMHKQSRNSYAIVGTGPQNEYTHARIDNTIHAPPQHATTHNRALGHGPETIADGVGVRCLCVVCVSFLSGHR